MLNQDTTVYYPVYYRIVEQRSDGWAFRKGKPFLNTCWYYTCTIACLSNKLSIRYRDSLKHHIFSCDSDVNKTANIVPDTRIYPVRMRGWNKQLEQENWQILFENCAY